MSTIPTASTTSAWWCRAGRSQPTGRGSDDCVGTTVALAECTVTFDTSAASGDGRVLLYRRGDDVARWQVTVG